MIPHIQTNTSLVDGNCWQTALASMLDLPAEAVPHFVGWEVHLGLDYWAESFQWLAWHRLLMDSAGRHLYTGEHYLVTGKSVRGAYHVCVYRNGKLAHDPHPSGVGLITEEFFVTVRPY